MTREIKFRGKPHNDDAFVYGNLCQGVFGDALIQVTIDKNFINNTVVMPETIGQYTGIKDKNGNEIYEGDITDKNRTINYRHGSFWIDMINGTGKFPMSFLQSDVCDFEIIGNIHDNPELL